MRVRWTAEASGDLIALAEHSLAQASAVLAAMDWMAALGFSLGRPVSRGGLRERYWGVPPQGVYYYRDGDLLVVTAVQDARQRGEPW
ncbi:MAG TPA: hypothetical protein VG015_01500 [Candidatus Dormibacteraeota bacterium]|nr:hypothetical protein [Candidatus Dormibacteraeota bacterium]